MLSKISPILFPTMETSNYEKMYFKGKSFYYKDKNLFINKLGELSTDTYYNSFSVKKWDEYTDLRELYLQFLCKGSFRLSIINTSLAFNKISENIVYCKIFDYKNENELVINLSTFLKEDGIISFKVEAFSDVEMRDISYSTSQNIQLPNIGLVICTFKREKYIKRFIESFEKYDKNDKLYAYIIDNGNTLKHNNVSSKIKILKNKNYGGAGGFSRGMLEVKHFNETTNDNKIDYIILMDDDIYVDFNIYYKLMSFLSLRKKEFNNYFLAGAMCSLDNKEWQYERYAQWCGNTFIQMSPGFDLTNIWCILENEMIEKVDLGTSGWWFCCFSTNILGSNNYPFPCFFRGDDVEFTIRNGSNIMTLNGINVWHEPFYKKYSIVSEDYYLLRNTLVLNTLYLNWVSAIDNIKYIFKRFAKSIIKYDYCSAELIIKALIDYQKGVAFFENTNPEELNKTLTQYNHKLVKIDKLKKSYRYKDIENNIVNENDSSKISKCFRFLTFNGNLLPWFMLRGEGASFIGYGSRAINFYRKHSVLNYDPYTKKGYITSRDFLLAVKLTLNFIKEAIKYYFRYDEVQKDYQTNFAKLQTEKFWRNYLEIEER